MSATPGPWRQSTATAPGSFRGSAFIVPLRVYYADTDAGGVVYHARYLDMAERCRTEMLRAMGWSVVGAGGSGFVVRRAAAEWHRPALLDDLLECRTTVDAVGAAQMTMSHRFARDGGDLLFEARLTLAHVSKGLRPTRLPAELRTALDALLACGDHESAERAAPR